MPGKGQNELSGATEPDDASASGANESAPSSDPISQPVPEKTQGASKIAFWKRAKSSEGKTKSDKNAESSSEAGKGKPPGGLLLFPRRGQSQDKQEPEPALEASKDESVSESSPDRDLWAKEESGAQWVAEAGDGFKPDPNFQSDWDQASNAAWLDPDSGVEDPRWNAPIKGEYERAQERAEERARIQERVRNQKLLMPDAPSKSWRTQTFTEAAGVGPEALKVQTVDEYEVAVQAALAGYSGDDVSEAPSAAAALTHSTSLSDKSSSPAGPLSKVDDSRAEQQADPSAKPVAQKDNTRKNDGARGANEIRNWYLSRLKARSKNQVAVSTANRRREILSQLTPGGSSSLFSVGIVLVLSLLLSIAAIVCQMFNLMPSSGPILPGAATLGIAIGAFMVFQSDQRFRRFKKEFEGKVTAETTDLDALALVEYLLKLQEYELADLREREQTLVDFTDEMLCTLDKNLRIIYANDTLIRNSGYTREDLQGKLFIDLIAVDQKDYAGRYVSDARASRKEKSFEGALRRKDGFTVEMNWQVEFSEGNNFFFCTARDISAQRAGERTQRQFLRLLDEEFKLPLTAIQGAFSMLRIGAYGTLPEQVLLRSNSIEKTTSKLIRVVSDIVDLELVENGKMELRIDDFPISVITEQALDAVQTAAEQKNISLKITNNRTRITADSERLLRVIVNMLSTGIYFSFENTSLIVEVFEQDSAVELQIKCHGRAISQSEHSRLFDRSKIGASESTISSGVIMAMSVSKGIIEKHGGTLQLQSIEGKGLIIGCRIPKIQRDGVKGSQFG